MLNNIQFNHSHSTEGQPLSCIVLDFVDGAEGLLYLRLAGAETATGAIWARLSARDARRKNKHGSDVQIPNPRNPQQPHDVATQPGIRYRTLRTRLPSGLVDLALVHPVLTATATQGNFHLLSYQRDMPDTFFNRLNSNLSLPLKAEWASWLWQQGQQPQSWLSLETKTSYDGKKKIETEALTEVTRTPIECLTTQVGQVCCYRVQVDGPHKQAWLKIIRSAMNLAVTLYKKEIMAEKHYHSADRRWVAHTTPAIYATDRGRRWVLHRDHQPVLSQVPSLNGLLSQARDTLGVHFVVKEENYVPAGR